MLSITSIPLGISISSTVLDSSLSDFKQSQLSTDGQPYDKVVIGAAIFRYNEGSSEPNLLLLKRAAHELYFPNIFEIPGGKVDSEDISIKHAVVREVKEETGLDLTEFISELKPMSYTTEKSIIDDDGISNIVVKTAIQLNYVVRVSAGDVRINTNEHSESIWATEGQLDELNITTAMKAVIQEAFGCSSLPGHG